MSLFLNPVQEEKKGKKAQGFFHPFMHRCTSVNETYAFRFSWLIFVGIVPTHWENWDFFFLCYEDPLRKFFNLKIPTPSLTWNFRELHRKGMNGELKISAIPPLTFSFHQETKTFCLADRSSHENLFILIFAHYFFNYFFLNFFFLLPFSECLLTSYNMTLHE